MNRRSSFVPPMVSGLFVVACSFFSCTQASESKAAPLASVSSQPSEAALVASVPAVQSASPSLSAPEPTALSAGNKGTSPTTPKVKVVNIGMHIGGGPNDAVTKDPIRRSVYPHFEAFQKCFSKVEDQKKGGDFGIDLLIPKDGGKAKVSHPRTALKGQGFVDCMVAAFEAIDFLKPRKGNTIVSYSLRFTP